MENNITLTSKHGICEIDLCKLKDIKKNHNVWNLLRNPPSNQLLDYLESTEFVSSIIWELNLVELNMDLKKETDPQYIKEKWFPHHTEIVKSLKLVGNGEIVQNLDISFLFPKVTFLKLKNLIIFIDSNTLKNYKNIIDLWVSDCEILSMDVEKFSNLKKLTIESYTFSLGDVRLKSNITKLTLINCADFTLKCVENLEKLTIIILKNTPVPKHDAKKWRVVKFSDTEECLVSEKHRTYDPFEEYKLGLSMKNNDNDDENENASSDSINPDFEEQGNNLTGELKKIDPKDVPESLIGKMDFQGDVDHILIDLFLPNRSQEEWYKLSLISKLFNNIAKREEIVKLIKWKINDIKIRTMDKNHDTIVPLWLTYAQDLEFNVMVDREFASRFLIQFPNLKKLTLKTVPTYLNSIYNLEKLIVNDDNIREPPKKRDICKIKLGLCKKVKHLEIVGVSSYYYHFSVLLGKFDYIIYDNIKKNCIVTVQYDTKKLIVNGSLLNEITFYIMSREIDEFDCNNVKVSISKAQIKTLKLTNCSFLYYTENSLNVDKLIVIGNMNEIFKGGNKEMFMNIKLIEIELEQKELFLKLKKEFDIRAEIKYINTKTLETKLESKNSEEIKYNLRPNVSGRRGNKNGESTRKKVLNILNKS